MKKELGDHIGKKNGWLLELAELAILGIKWLFAKNKLKVTKTMTSPTCNKNDPNDPNYGKAGNYDSDCVWHPWVLQE